MREEELLPPEVLRKAKRSGEELAWRKEDLESAVLAARDRGLACLGGQPQFIFPDGTCELYWVNYDPGDRKGDETWQAYVERTASQVLEAFRLRCAETDFREEAQRFGFLKEKIAEGKADLIDHLWFVVYFAPERGAAAQARSGSAKGDAAKPSSQPVLSAELKDEGDLMERLPAFKELFARPGGVESISDAQAALNAAHACRELFSGPERYEKEGHALERAIALGLQAYCETAGRAISMYFHYYTGGGGPELGQRKLAEILARDEPGNAVLLFQQAKLRRRFGKADAAALEKVERSIALAPCAAAFALRAGLLSSLARIPEALADCDAGLALEPQRIELLRLRCLLRLGRDDFSGALADADTALGLREGELVNLRQYRIRALLCLGRVDEAAQAARQLKALGPGSTAFENDLPLLCFYDLPEIVKRRPDLEAAVERVREALRL